MTKTMRLLCDKQVAFDKGQAQYFFAALPTAIGTYPSSSFHLLCLFAGVAAPSDLFLQEDGELLVLSHSQSGVSTSSIIFLPTNAMKFCAIAIDLSDSHFEFLLPRLPPRHHC